MTWCHRLWDYHSRDNSAEVKLGVNLLFNERRREELKIMKDGGYGSASVTPILVSETLLTTGC